MITHIDRNAGFAAFAQGRSACLRLDGTLDMAMARGIEDHLRGDNETVRLRLECSTLAAIDAGAARTLARAVLAWSHARPDRSVDILNLEPSIADPVAWHPLRWFTDPDELVFIDPDRDTAWDTVPSRH